jgi:hypothetical protein
MKLGLATFTCSSGTMLPCPCGCGDYLCIPEMHPPSLVSLGVFPDSSEQAIAMLRADEAARTPHFTAKRAHE